VKLIRQVDYMAAGKLGVMIAGVLGTISTTLITGTWAIRNGIAPVRGLLTETDFVSDLPLVILNKAPVLFFLPKVPVQ
jgi:hypothetical protein